MTPAGDGPPSTTVEAPKHHEAQPRPVTWDELLLGAAMLVLLMVCFVPALVLYAVLFGMGAVMRLLDLATGTPPETA